MHATLVFSCEKKHSLSLRDSKCNDVTAAAWNWCLLFNQTITRYCFIIVIFGVNQGKMTIIGSVFVYLVVPFLFLSVFLLYLYFKIQFKFWSELGVRHPKPSFPFGNSWEMFNRTSMGQFFKNYYDQFKDERIVGLWIFYRPILLVRDIELIKNIFVKDFGVFQDRGYYVNERDDPLSGKQSWFRFRV